jgi:hypothetical protein
MATTAYSTLYDSSGNPIAGRPKSSNVGYNDETLVGLAFATTALDLLADFTFAIPVRAGKTIEYLDLGEWTELDTGGGNALDMDIVLRTTSGAGVVTDTILFNAGSFFTAAQTAGAIYRVWCMTKVPDCASGVGHIGFLVNAAASTANAGTGNIHAHIV